MKSERAKLKENNSEDTLLNLVEDRWSPRAFSDEMIEKKDIISMFEAGRNIASSYNEQPWAFIICRKEDAAYNRLFDCLDEFNQSWAHTAPYLGVVLSKKYFEKTMDENPHHAYDSGAFMAVASLRAFELDIFIHQMAGFFPEKVSENFEIPENFTPITMFVIGKMGEADQLPSDLQKKETPHSGRKNVEEFLYDGSWGNPF